MSEWIRYYHGSMNDQKNFLQLVSFIIVLDSRCFVISACFRMTFLFATQHTIERPIRDRYLRLRSEDYIFIHYYYHDDWWKFLVLFVWFVFFPSYSRCVFIVLQFSFVQCTSLMIDRDYEGWIRTSPRPDDSSTIVQNIMRAYICVFV